MKLSYLVVLATAVVAQLKDFEPDVEYHPPMTIERCTAPGQCVQEKTKVVLDSNWRWYRDQGNTNCFADGFTQKCIDNPDSCAKDCHLAALSKEQYENTYGIKSSGEGKLKLNYRNTGGDNTEGKASIGSRVYLLNENNDQYKMFHLNNKEFTFDADVSELDCGLNGALYFVEMEPDGHMNEFNTAGSAYGTGYCDAQCPHDVKYIYGKPNSLEYKKGKNGAPGGGKYGICCTEMDIWEANKHSNAYTPHACLPGYHRCDNNTACGEGDGNRYKGFCDKDGCDFNPYRNGNKTFYGPGSQYTVDTTQKVTVITQFITHNGKDDGQLTEIRRLYVQNEKVIENPPATWKSSTGVNYDAKGINDPFCYAEKKAFGELEKDDFSEKDGLQPMGEANNRGLVLVLSVWTDPVSEMRWLDSKEGEGKGAERGTCQLGAGKPEKYNKDEFNTISTEFAKIRYGPLGSTFANPENKIKSVPDNRPIDPKNEKTPQPNDNYDNNDNFIYPPGVVPNTGAGNSGGKPASSRPGAITPSTNPSSPSPNGNSSPSSGSGSSSGGSTSGGGSSNGDDSSSPSSGVNGGSETSSPPPAPASPPAPVSDSSSSTPSTPSTTVGNDGTNGGTNGGTGNTDNGNNGGTNGDTAAAPAPGTNGDTAAAPAPGTNGDTATAPAPPPGQIASGAEIANMSLLGVTSAMVCAIMALRFMQ